MIACTATEQQVARRLADVRARIAAAGGDPELVTVLAVTKGFDRVAVDRALAVGLTAVGENYAQELVAKAELVPDVAWHFIGRLQRNKVRSLAPHVTLWQSVDRPELGAEIARRAPDAQVLVQVDVSGEAQKGGCAPAAVPALVADLTADGLSVRGLMAVAAAGPDQVTRPQFRIVRDLADRLGLEVRSMGMTTDLEAAVAEGSSMVRVGTALFGPRQAPEGPVGPRGAEPPVRN